MRTPGSSEGAPGDVRDATPGSGPLRTPGLVDQHCHGAHGVDFATAPTGDVREVVRDLCRRGITRVVASLPALSPAETLAAVRRLSPLVHDGTLAGLHLEGPFLARNRCGAHAPENLREPADTTALSGFDEVLEAGRDGDEQAIVAVTYAPELDGTPDLESLLAAHRVLPALGHTDATAAEFRAALHRLAHAGDDDGPAPSAAPDRTPTVTHLFNAMRGFHHRDPGPLPVALRAAAAGRLRVELIADGHHVVPEVVAEVLELLPGSVCVVSDASAATGAAPGPHRLGGLPIEVSGSAGDGVPRLADGATLASGAVTLDGALRNLVRWGVTLPVALGAVCTTPARGLPARRRNPGWVDWVTDPGTGTPAPGLPAAVVPGGGRRP